MVQYCRHADLQYVVQIFIDYGEGFSEENSQKLLNCYLLGKHLRLEFDIPEGAVKFRIDPCSFSCVVEILKIQVGDRRYSAEEIVANGCWQECGVVVFDHEDPHSLCRGTTLRNPKLKLLFLHGCLRYLRIRVS